LHLCTKHIYYMIYNNILTMNTKLLTNIDSIYYTFIEEEARENKTTKRSVIEKAINHYMTEQKKRKIKNEYAKMWKDKEYLDEMVDNSNYLSYL